MEVRQTILADNPEEAKKLVLESVEIMNNESMVQDAYWDDKDPPSVMLNNEELFMKITKAPMMFIINNYE